MKKIFSSSGHCFFVDDEDFSVLSEYKWHVLVGKDGHLYANSSEVGLMHRFISKPTNGMLVDHINGNGFDNRRKNIRVCTATQNQANRRLNRNSSSGYKGVYWNKVAEKWASNIQLNGKRYYIGLFSTKELAAEAYNKKALEFFGEFSYLN